MSSSQWPPQDIHFSPWGRIKLIPLDEKDDSNIVTLRTDPETRRYLPYMPADLTSEQWKERREERSRNKKVWDLNIHITSEHIPRLSGTKECFAGECGVSAIDRANKSGEIGILIRSDLYRNYIATEALYCNLVLAFEHPELELYRVEFVTAQFNVRMRGWLERFGIGMEYTKKEAWSDGQGGRLDVVVYVVLRPDWPALKARLKDELDVRISPSIRTK